MPDSPKLNKPNLSVPQAQPPRQGRGGLSGLAFVLLLILLVVNVMRFFIAPPGTVSSRRGTPEAGMPDVEQLKQVAIDLENKNISSEAADLWERYLEMAKLTSLEAGNIRYRVGKLRFEAGQFDKAFAQYALAEKMLGDSSPDLAHEIGLRRVECLRRLGRWADVAREVSDRATIGVDESGLSGQQIVAEIGGQKMTVSEFDWLLTNQIEIMVNSRLGLSSEEQAAFRKRAHEQFADPQIRGRELQRIVAMRVLAAEAHERNLHQDAEFRDRLQGMADSILAQTLLHEEVSKRGTVTDEDIERFYKANVDRYTEPVATFIAHILCKNREHATDVIQRILEGASFEDIARSESVDMNTKDKLGILSTPVSADGELVPGFGANAELHAAIREGEASRVLDTPYQNDQGWHVIKIVSHRERVQQPLEDVIEQVRQDTKASRDREVTEQFIAELFDDRKVKIHLNALGVESSDTAPDKDTSDSASP